MRWKDLRRSGNIEDRRGGGALLAGGGVGAVVVSLVLYFLTGDPGALQSLAPEPRSSGTQDQELSDFVSSVLASTEDVWKQSLGNGGRSYQEPHLVLFSGGTKSGCGFAQEAMGPFYCPLDTKIYLDLNFFRDLSAKLGAPGDFAQAYVIAHEVGHHVQHLLGTLERARALQQRASNEAEANAIQVRVELQADCFSGIWAHRAQATQKVLEPGDIEEALDAAAAVGDDTLQKRSQGRVVPDSFTHGSAAQRASWFRKGFEGGEIGDCNTFATNE